MPWTRRWPPRSSASAASTSSSPTPASPRAARPRRRPTGPFERVIEVNLMGVCGRCARRCRRSSRAQGARRGRLLDLRLHQRHRRDALRDEQGGRRAARPRACGPSWTSTARAPASRTSGSSTPRWSPGDRRRPARRPDAGRSPARCGSGSRRRPGAAIVDGIEARAAHHPPPALDVMSVLRGIINPLIDARLERDPEAQAMLRELDARAGERTPMTA